MTANVSPARERRRSHTPSTLPPDLRSRQRLRQDPARFATGDPARRRDPRPQDHLPSAAAIASQFATPASRQELVDVIASVPAILQGLAGKPVNVEHAGRLHVTTSTAIFFPLVVSLWSIIALSGTLAAEARRGSLEFVAATPHLRAAGSRSSKLLGARRRAGHRMRISCSSSIAIAGSAFAKLPGDEISVGAAFAYALWLFLMALAARRASRSPRPRSSGAARPPGIAGAVMFGGFILNGYQAAIPAIAPVRQPDVVRLDVEPHPAGGPVRLAIPGPGGRWSIVVLIRDRRRGVRPARPRRDGRRPDAAACPNSLAGLRGPIGRAAAEGIPSALAWGIGHRHLRTADRWLRHVVHRAARQRRRTSLKPAQTVFPEHRLRQSSAGSWNCCSSSSGSILVGPCRQRRWWASGLRTRPPARLEFLLATPLSRGRWVVSGGVALIGLVVLVTVISAIGIAIGAVIAGGDVLAPALGTIALGLYASPWPASASRSAGMSRHALRRRNRRCDRRDPDLVRRTSSCRRSACPTFVHDLALTGHYGLPMLGQWDPAGVVASLVLGGRRRGARVPGGSRRARPARGSRRQKRSRGSRSASLRAAVGNNAPTGGRRRRMRRLANDRVKRTPPGRGPGA